MSPSSSQSTTAKIFVLPPELVERVLILSSYNGYPQVVGSLGQTCRYFTQLIYYSADNHLWRELFLTTFDDPRPLLGRLKASTTFSPTGGALKSTVDIPFDWKGEFTRRIAAKRLFLDYLEGDHDTNSVTNHGYQSLSLSCALRSLLCVLESSSPFPSHYHGDFTMPNPTFPPIIILHASPIPFPDEFKSLNSAWMESILQNGYPPSLVQKLLVDGHQRHRQKEKGSENVVWEISEEGQLFHKLVFLKGFLPASTLVPPLTYEAETTVTHSGTIGNIPSSRSSVSEQLDTAREMARSKVYNLRYLMPERCWGPFLPTNDTIRGTILSARHSGLEEELSSQIRDVGVAIEQPGQMTSDDHDGYYPLLSINGPESFQSDSGADDDSLGQISEDDEDLALILNGRVPDAAFVPPEPHQLVPDYAFLSAARLLVEMNLKEILDSTNTVAEYHSVDASVSRIVDAFSSLDLARMGGAPSFWNMSWVILPDSSDTFEAKQDLPGNVNKGKGVDNEVSDLEGWDWAGVAGEWKRSVCWLDYHDLLLHNLTGFPNESLEETMRIFPMTLWVSGYSKPPDPDLHSSPRDEFESLVWRLPVIHIEGESRGSDIDSTALRRVKGTVRMIGGGAVRWSLTSSYPDEDSPEWLTEGVQVGSIGSAVGMIGMWTGAEHASTDPLGPVWAWKVA